MPTCAFVTPDGRRLGSYSGTCLLSHVVQDLMWRGIIRDPARLLFEVGNDSAPLQIRSEEVCRVLQDLEIYRKVVHRGSRSSPAVDRALAALLRCGQTVADVACGSQQIILRGTTVGELGVSLRPASDEEGPAGSSPTPSALPAAHSWLTIKIMMGKQLQLYQILPGTSILDVKYLIHGSEGIPPEQQHLFYIGDGRRRAYADSDIDFPCLLNLVLRLRGGCGERFAVRCSYGGAGSPVVLNVRQTPLQFSPGDADAKARIRRWVGAEADVNDILPLGFDDGDTNGDVGAIGNLHVEYVGDPGAANALVQLCRDHRQPSRYVWPKPQMLETLRGLRSRAPGMPSEVRRKIAQFLPPPDHGEWLRGTSVEVGRIERCILPGGRGTDPDLLEAELRFWPKTPIPPGTIRVEADPFVLEPGGRDHGQAWVWYRDGARTEVHEDENIGNY